MVKRLLDRAEDSEDCPKQGTYTDNCEEAIGEVVGSGTGGIQHLVQQR